MPRNCFGPANTPSVPHWPRAEIDRGSWDEEWPYLKVQAELAEGKYARALETLEAALDSNGWSLRLRYLARSVYLHNGKSERAASALGAFGAVRDGRPAAIW